MGDRNDQGLPPDLADVGERLRANRTRPSALELDQIKLQVKARARRRSPQQLRRGVGVRSRGVTLVLALLLIGGTTAGGIASSGGDNNGDGGAAQAQYKPPRCTPDMRKCECPNGYHLTAVNNQIVCERNAPQDCNKDGDNDRDDQCKGNDNEGDGGHGHHHHGDWKQGGNGHWQWSDDGHHWNNWNGSENDW
jgi:hypothetical protein